MDFTINVDSLCKPSQKINLYDIEEKTNLSLCYYLSFHHLLRTIPHLMTH